MSGASDRGGRRAFLRGVSGTCLALPLLEYTHGRAWAAGESSAKRFVVFFSHGGEAIPVFADGTRERSPNGDFPLIDDWMPEPGSHLGVAHRTFKGTSLEAKVTVVRGVDNNAAVVQGTYGGGHGHSNELILTAADHNRPECEGEAACEGRRPLGPSIDAVVAERLAARLGGRTTPLHLLVPGHQYGSPFYRGAGERQSGEVSPRSAFTALFAGLTTHGGPDPAALKRNEVRSSVLNGLGESYRRFRRRVGARDRAVVDAHLDHLSALEKEITGITVSAQCSKPAEPIHATYYDGNQDQIAAAHAGIIVAALRCGLTHVANLEVSDIITPWAPSGAVLEPAAGGLGHTLGHFFRDVGPTGTRAGDVERWKIEFRENRAWRMQVLRSIAEGLDDPTFMEGDRTMLDGSLLLYTSEFSNPPVHAARDMPYLLVGSAGGYFRTGRFVDMNRKRRADPNTHEYEARATNNNLYTSVLNAFGEPDTHFGGDWAYQPGPIGDLR